MLSLLVEVRLVDFPLKFSKIVSSWYFICALTYSDQLPSYMVDFAPPLSSQPSDEMHDVTPEPHECTVVLFRSKFLLSKRALSSELDFTQPVSWSMNYPNGKFRE